MKLIKQKQTNYVNLKAVSNLTSMQSRKFLNEHHLPRNEQQTNLGMRTARFTINHDPHNAIPEIFPEYLCLLREQQLEKIISKLSKDNILNLDSNSNQFLGTINAEKTINPCIKTLLLFSVIYMDGIPIMEKQFITLTKLFPILDPFMANKLKDILIEKEIGHIQWIFYLDYDWIDQIIDNSKANGAYHIYLNNLNMTKQNKISSYLLQKNLLGNFIWLSKKAWQRLQIESPYMGNIVETLEIEDGTNEIIYAIKFEQLIPRLQKYYNFEANRDILKSYDIRPQTRNFIRVMKHEVDKSLTVEKLMVVLENLSNYQWQGFSERRRSFKPKLKSIRQVQ